MITFVDGRFDEKKANATVILTDDAHQGFAERDEEGNIKVTIDYTLEPEVGSFVKLVLHSENNGEYVGVIGEGGVFRS